MRDDLSEAKSSRMGGTQVPPSPEGGEVVCEANPTEIGFDKAVKDEKGDTIP